MANRKKTAKFKYIDILHKYYGTKGKKLYRVRFSSQGKVYQKTFSEHKYGEKALELAQEYRDKSLVELPKRVAPKKRSNNKSGIPGVRKQKIIYRRDDKELTYNVWEAYWYDDQGKMKRRRFFINKYGSREAKKLAIDCRKEMVQKFYDINNFKFKK